MATRSAIGMVEQNGNVLSIYCHWDGYPEHNGMLLCKHWDDVYFVEQLMQLGNLSCLGSEIGERQNFDQPTDSNWCLAYGRDRGERDSLAKSYGSASEFIREAAGDYGADYIYLFQDNQWRCWNYDGKEYNLYSMTEDA